MKKFYKTFLSGLLAAAMIFTSVPEVAMAAALPDADTEILAEEISEVSEDVTVVENSTVDEDNLAPATDSVVEHLGSTDDKYEPEDSLEIDPLYSNQDVELQLNLTAAYTGSDTAASQYALANTGDDPAVIDLDSAEAKTDLGSQHQASKYGTTDSATCGYITVDSTQAAGYTFYVKLDEGYDFDLEEGAAVSSIIKEMEYYDFSTINHDAYNAAASIEAAKKTVEASQYTVERVSPRLAKVTLPQTLLEAVEKGSYYKDYNAAYADQAEYRFNPQLKIVVTQKTKLRTRTLDLTKDITLSSDLEKKSAISAANHTVTYNTSKGANDISPLFAHIDGTSGYVTNKALDAVADMMTVTYTPVTSEASTSKETVAKVAIVASDSAKTVNGTASTPIYANYMQDSDTIKIYSTWANDFVMGYADLKISIDGTKTDSLYKTVTVTPNSYVEGVYKDNTTEDLNGTKFAYASPLSFDIKLPTTATGRSIKTVKAVEKNDGTEFTASTGDNFINSSVTVDDDITITVTTQESVNVSAVATGVVLYDADGEKISDSTKIESGTEGYTVKIVPAKGQVIDDVKYTFEGDEDGWKDIKSSLTTESVVTIPAKIEKQLDLYVTQKAAGATKDVDIINLVDGTAIGSQAAPIKDGITNIYSGNDTTNGFGSTSWTVEDGVTNGEYYYFIVKTAANYEPVAKYYMGTSAIATPTTATATAFDAAGFKNATLVKVLDGETHTEFLYRTTEKVGATTAGVELYISARQVTKIVAPANTQVSASFGSYVWVPSDETYSFSLNTKNALGTITIDKVTETNNNSAPDAESTELTKSGTVYSVAAGVLGDAATGHYPVKLFAATTDKVDPSKFTVKFVLANDDAKVPRLTGEVGSQKLTLGFTEATTDGALTAEFNATDRIKSAITSSTEHSEDKATTTKDAEGMYPASYAASDAVGKNIVTLATSGNGSTVTGAEIGTDTITSTLIRKGSNGEKTVYAGTLDVEVKEAYTDLHLVAVSNYTSATEPAVMAQASATTTDDTPYVVNFVIKGTDTRDNKVKTITSGLNSIEWAFDPDNNNTDAADKTYKMDAAHNTAWAGMVSRITTGPSYGVYVRAKDATTSSLDVVAKVKMYADSTAQTLTLPLTIIAENNYAPFLTYQYATGTEKEVGWQYSDPNITVPANQTVSVELNAKGQNSYTANYPLYMRNTGKTGAAISTKSALDTAVKAGTYSLVTEGVTYTVVVSEADKAYVNASVTDAGVLTISGIQKAANIPVVLKAYKDGVLVAQNTFTTTVVDEKARTSVRLLLDDPQGAYTKPATNYVPKQQALTSGYLSGKTAEIVEPNNNVKYTDLVTDHATLGSVVSVRGVIFTMETAGSSFTLPEQKDFETANLGANRILTGWERVTLSGKTATTASEFFYPGEKIEVAASPANAIYRAVWVDEYTFGSDVTSSVADHEKEASKIYNAALGTDSDKDGKIDSAPEWGVVTNAGATSSPAASIAAGNTLPLALKLIHAVPYDADKKATITTNATTDFTNDTKEDVYKTGSDLTITLAGSNKNLASVDASTGALKVAADVDAKLAGTDLTVSVAWGDFKSFAMPLAITANEKYTVDWTSASPKNATSMLVDQASNNTLTATIKKNGLVQGDTQTTYFTNWSLTYKAVPEGIVELTAKDKADKVGQASAGANVVTVTPLKAGTVTITVDVKDGTGLDISADYSLEIKDNGVGLTITDIATNETVEGTKEDPLYAKGTNNITPSTSINYNIIGTNDGGITLQNGVGDGDSAANGYIASYTVQPDGKSIQITSDAYNTDLGTGYILLKYTKNGGDGTIFQRKLYVSTYYEMKLKGDSANWLIVKDSKDLAADAPGIVRVTEATQIDEDTNPDDNVHIYKYTGIDLSAFSAKGTGTNNGKVFLGWKIEKVNLDKATDKVHFTNTMTKKLGKTDHDGTAAQTLESGNYTLIPIFGNNPITKAVVAQTTIKLSNEGGGAALATTAEKASSKEFSISVTPYNTSDTIVVVPDKTKSALFTNKTISSPAVGVIGYKDKDTYKEATASLGFLKGEIPFGTNQTSGSQDGGVVVDSSTQKRTDNFNVAAIVDDNVTTRRAGEIAFELKSKESGAVLNTITVYINGYDAVDKVYMEDGKVVKADKRQVNGETWFFDENGAHVTGDAVVTKADGSKIIIADGQLVSGGLVTLTGKFAGTYYVKEDGTVATKEVIKLSGVDRLFREDGTLVTYTDSDVEGGKITVDGKVYVIDKDTNESKLDKEYFYTSSTFNWTFSTGTVPVATVDVVYTAEDGTKLEEKAQAATIAKDGDIFGTISKFTATYTTKYPQIKGGEAVELKESKIYDTSTMKEATAYLKAAPSSKDWTWDEKLVTITSIPEASVNVTIVVISGTETQEVTDTIKASVEKTSKASETSAKFTATATANYYASATATEATAYTWTDNRSYKLDKKTGEIIEGSDTGNFSDDAEETGVFTASFVNGDEYVYTGAAIKPAIVVNNGDKTLVQGVDYTVSYKNNTVVAEKTAAAKAPTVIVKGKGNYSASLILYFSITKANIADAAIGNLAYKTGTADTKIKPTANYKGKNLKFGTDYTVELGELDSGTNTRTATIKGAGNNFDPDSSIDVTISYLAKVAKISATINLQKSYPYTGEEVLTVDQIKELVTVTGLADGANFYVTVGDNVNAGTCKVAVTADGFSGIKTASFKIDPAKTATMTVTNKDELTTDGTAFKVLGATPNIAIDAKIDDDHEYTLTPGVDYKVSYSNNKAAGTGTAKIAFMGNYKGAQGITQTFKINKANLSDANVKIAGNFVKGNNAKSKQYFAVADKKLFVSIDGMQIKKNEYTVTYKQGEATLTGKENLTFEDGKATITVVITPSAKAKSLEGDAITAEYDVLESATGTDVTKGKVTVVEVNGTKAAKIGYTGTEITFAQDDENRQGDIQLKIGKTIVSAKDIEDHFDVQYVNNITKGKATIILTAKEGDETYTGSATGVFNIKAHAFSKKDLLD